MEIFAKVVRGQNAGVVLRSHLHKDGMYVVSKTRFQIDYIRVTSLQDIEERIANGFSVRMSNLEDGVTAASIISQSSIFISV